MIANESRLIFLYVMSMKSSQYTMSMSWLITLMCHKGEKNVDLFRIDFPDKRRTKNRKNVTIILSFSSVNGI